MIIAKKIVSKPAIKNNKNNKNKNNMYIINFKSLRNIILNIKCLNFSVIFFILKKYFLTKFLNEFKTWKNYENYNILISRIQRDLQNKIKIYLK